MNEKLTKGHIYEPNRINWGNDAVYALPKLNGLRVCFRDGGLFSYDNKRYSEKVVPHLYKVLSRVYRIYGRALDGELYRHGWPLQRINAAGAVNRKSPGEESHLLKFYVFDVVSSEHFLKRYRMYRNIVSSLQSEHVRSVQSIRIETEEEANSVYRNFIKRGYEGAIYRINDCQYEFGRQWHVLKRKDWLDDEFKVIGLNEEIDKNGKPKGRMGALVCKTISGKRFSVGTGFSAQEREDYWDNPPIKKKLKVKYLTLSEDGIPLNLSSLGIREQA